MSVASLLTSAEPHKLYIDGAWRARVSEAIY